MRRMSHIYVHHRISTAPRQWAAVAARLSDRRTGLEAAGGALYGVWRSQIGRPRDELTAITSWSAPVSAGQAQAVLVHGDADVLSADSEAIVPTLRPTGMHPPERQGNYAFRWFATPEAHWEEFLSLCARAWPGFEAAYDSQVIGLWRSTGDATAGAVESSPGAGDGVRSLLLTRRPDLAMWERSKIPRGEAEAAVRDALSRRYDLCTWTYVHTTTLITASDSADTARWT